MRVLEAIAGLPKRDGRPPTIIPPAPLPNQGSAGVSPVQPSPFSIAEKVERASSPPSLIASEFLLDEDHVLTPEEQQHLTFCHRHGMNAHAEEVTALMEAFVMSHDAEHLRRAKAILQHQIELHEA